MSPLALIVLLPLVLGTTLCMAIGHVDSPARRRATALAAGAVAAAAWFVSGLLAAGILLLVAFAVGHEVLMGLGVIALLATLSRYYYGLEATLLIKSAALAATCVALLAARYGMRFVPPTPGEAGDA